MENENVKYELKTVCNQVSFRILDGNPFRKKSENNLLIATADDLNNLNEADKELTGKINELEQNVYCGYVTSAGPDCKTVKMGDIIYFGKYEAVPIPYYDGIDEIVYKIHEQQIYGVVSKVE